MGDSIGIGRVPTDAERQDYVQLGTITPQKKFLADLAKVEMEFVRRHEPFDSQCAKFDFADKLENLEKESQRRNGFVKGSDVLVMKFDNLEKYGDIKRFKLIDDDVELEMQNVNNTKTAVKTGHTMKYVCDRGHGCSVFVPIELYEERFGEKKKNIVKEIK